MISDLVPSLSVIEGNQIIESRGRWEGHRLFLEQTLGFHSRRQTVEVVPDMVLIETLILKLVSDGRLAPGLRDTLQVFDYTALQAQTVYVSCGTADVDDGQEMEVQTRFAGPDGAEMVVYTRVNRQGLELGSRIPVLGVS